MTSEAGARPIGKPPRSIDVARLAGVSRATVSHVLNGQEDRFTQETVERVHAAARELGYVPSAAGRALVRGRSDIVMIVVPFTTMPGLQDLVDVLSKGLAEHGFSAVVQLAGPPGSDAYVRLRQTAESMRPAGLIDLGGLLVEDQEALRRLGSPVVGTALDSDGAGSNIAFGRVQTRHLVERGYRHLAYAFLTDERGHPFDQGRAQGIREVCSEHGLSEPYLFGVALDPGDAVGAVKAMLKSVLTPVGIACFNDEVALAVIHAARELGVEIPGQIGVVGMGRTPVARLSSPRISTVSGDSAPLLTALLDALLIEYGGAQHVTEVDFGMLQVDQGETT